MFNIEQFIAINYSSNYRYHLKSKRETTAIKKNNDKIFFYPQMSWGFLELHVFRGAWVGQLVMHMTLSFSSDHDFKVMRSNPRSGSVLDMEPTKVFFFPLPLPPPPSNKCLIGFSWYWEEKKKKKCAVITLHIHILEAVQLWYSKLI